MDRLGTLDRALFGWINGHANALLDRVMPVLSDDGLFKPVFLLVWLVLVVRGGRGRLAALLVVPLLVISDQLSSNLLKHAIERVRPCHVLPDVRLLAGCSASWSMPSSHAANSGAAAFHFTLFYPRLGWILVPLAVAVAYSRVYVGVHYPADVLVGLAVGFAAAAAVRGGYAAGRRWRRARAASG